jgi:hypothetical protein
LESISRGPEGETEDQRRQRVGERILEEGICRALEIVAIFRTQFRASTDADIAAWNEALARLTSAAPGGPSQRAAIEEPGSPLGRIAVDPTQTGNSMQDLRLSLLGWRLGQMLRAGAFADRHAVADWMRRSLAP